MTEYEAYSALQELFDKVPFKYKTMSYPKFKVSIKYIKKRGGDYFLAFRERPVRRLIKKY